MTLIATPAIDSRPTHPPKLARELKDRLRDLFARYSMDEVLAEIAAQKPRFDIYVCAAGQKHSCPTRGAPRP